MAQLEHFVTVELEILQPTGGDIDLEARAGGFDIESEAGGLWPPCRQPGSDSLAQAQALLLILFTDEAIPRFLSAAESC